MSRQQSSAVPPRPGKRQVVSRAIVVLAALAAGLTAGVMVGSALKRSGVSPRLEPADLLVLPVATFLAILVHELGHVLAGRLAGMRFLLLVVGPFKLTRDASGFQLRLNGNIATWGGLALLLPPDAKRLRDRLAWTVAGGPLASLLLAAAAGALILPLTGKWALAFTLLALVSGALFVATLIPVASGGFASDGAQLLGLRRGDAGAEGRAILAALTGASLSGTRPRDYDPTLLARGLELKSEPMQRMAMLLLAGMRALDRGEAVEEFFDPLEPHWASLPNGVRQGFALWLAYYHARVRRDPASSRAWLEKGRGGLFESADLELAEAALALAQGDRAHAAAAVHRGLTRRAGLDPGGAALVRDLLQSIGREVGG